LNAGALAPSLITAITYSIVVKIRIKKEKIVSHKMGQMQLKINRFAQFIFL
jgi:hypothetical protein